MGYPEGIDQFPAKLNKKTDGSVYVIEEELPITDGKYEGLLAHDNITNTSIRVYTGPKLTGEEIINYIISIPADTTWRRQIKVFAEVSKVYVTYETQGDIVEAGDVNVLQESITATQGEVDRYKAANGAVVSGIDARLKVAENAKAEKTYVDTQLLLKADKANTYTKTETDQRIQNVVAAAPAALDTLQEIAKSLNNDVDFAGTMTTQLAGKADMVTGKGLSTEDYTTVEKTKLSGIAAGAGTAGSAADTVIGNRTISDSETPNGNSGMLTSLLGWLANMIKSVTGKPNWRTVPAITLEVTKNHVDNVTDAHDMAKRMETIRSDVISYVEQSISDAEGKFPKSLPANGGNADTVDGMDSTSFGRLVCTTTMGGTSDANYWTKIATINFGQNDYSDVSSLLAISDCGGNATGSCLLSISCRQDLSSSITYSNLNILGSGKMHGMTDSSFKIVNNGYGNDFELWMKKGTTYHVFKIYELARAAATATVISYISNYGWQASEPTGTYSTTSAGLTYLGNTVWHSGNDGAGSGLAADTAETAATANKLANVRKINGVAFDGSKDIAIPFAVTGTTWNQLKGG